MIIDCHIHARNRNQKRRRRQSEWSSNIVQPVPGLKWAYHRKTGPDNNQEYPLSLIKSMDQYNVDKAVLLATNWPRNNPNYTSNEYVADLVKEHPDRIIGFASVDPLKGETAAKELKAAICNLGLKGLKLHPPMQRFSPKDKRCFPVYKMAEELEIPVLFHGGWSTIPNSYTRYGNPLLFDDVAKEFPKLKIMVAHLGGGFYREMLWVMTVNQKIFSDISGTIYYTSMLFHPMSTEQVIKTFIDKIGADRLVYGSDGNIAYAETILQILRKIGLDDDDQEKIMSQNIKKIIRL